MVPDAEAEQRLCAELLELAPAAASASLSRTGGANVSVTAAQVASVRVVASRVSRFHRPQMGLERLERSLPRIGMDNATSLLARTFDSASLLDRRPLFKSHHPKALRLAEQAVKNRDRHPILLECFRGDGVPPTHYEAMPVRDLRALATKTKSSKTKPRYLSKVRQCIGLGCVHPADRLLVEIHSCRWPTLPLRHQTIWFFLSLLSTWTVAAPAVELPAAELPAAERLAQEGEVRQAPRPAQRAWKTRGLRRKVCKMMKIASKSDHFCVILRARAPK